MKIRHLFYLFFTITLIIFWFIFMFKNEHKETIQERDILAWTISLQTEKEFKEKHNLNLIAFSLSTDKKLLKTIGLSFSLNHSLNKKEGRVLILKCIKEFIDNINGFEEIQPYLFDHPFTDKNIKITLFFYKDEKYTKILHPDVCGISFANGVIDFDTKEASPPHRYQSTEQESFEEAKRIVQEEDH